MGRLGSASGIVNVGGFCASILLILGIGAVLDAFGAAHSLTAFRWAFALQYLLWTVGAVQVLRYRNAARRRMSPGDLAALRRGVLPVPAEA